MKRFKESNMWLEIPPARKRKESGLLPRIHTERPAASLFTPKWIDCHTEVDLEHLRPGLAQSSTVLPEEINLSRVEHLNNSAPGSKRNMEIITDVLNTLSGPEKKKRGRYTFAETAIAAAMGRRAGKLKAISGRVWYRSGGILLCKS